MSALKKKILCLITQAEWGGAQRYVFDLAASLQNDFDITVATGTNGTSQELIDKIRDERYEIKIISFKHLRREINPYHDILAVFEIARFLRQNHFDIIHLNSSKAGVISALAGWLVNHQSKIKNLKSKIIYTAHGWVYLEPLPFWRRWIYLWMEKIAAKLRDVTIVLSEKEKEIALKYGTGKKESIFVIPNGINANQSSFLPKEEAIKQLNNLTIKQLNNKIIIGTIANLYKTKGLEYLIDAIKILNIPASPAGGQYPISNIQLIVIGEGPEKENLRLQITGYRLQDDIILTGVIPNAYRYLQAFDIFVLPSVKEGFPYTILEAMAAGLPIVATAVGGIPEMIENQKSGLIIPAAEPQKLAEAILDLTNNPDKARNLGREAERRVREKFVLANMVEKTKMVYQNAGSPFTRE